jgi:hypothetical protein
MQSGFAQSLENVLRSVANSGPAPGPAPRPAPGPTVQPKRPPGTEPGTETVESRHRKWFALSAADRVMPLLTHTVEALKQRGISAHCRLVKDGEALTAELTIVPPGLPHGARPPLLAIAAAPGPSGLSIDYTGTFPNAGLEGGFAAEIGYDTVYTSEIEEQLLQFVRLATGA